MIVIIGGCGANLASVQFAVARLGKKSKISVDKNEIVEASHVILPGVGTAEHGMKQLAKLDLIDTIRALTQPVLGICLGMQLLFERSEEGNVDCLGLLKGEVKALPKKPGLTFPHMGWNTLNWQNEDSVSILRDGIDQNVYVYFVHSYAVPVSDLTVATTEYGSTFSSIVQHKHFYATQFHPERSGKIGAKILENFLKLRS